MIRIDHQKVAIPDDMVPDGFISFYSHGFFLGTFAKGSEQAKALASSGAFDEVRMSPQMCWVFQSMKIDRAHEALQARH